DTAIHGYGGCPMAADALTGNIATEDLENFANQNNIDLNLNTGELYKAYEESWKIFNNFH
ncbi:MAG TPA: hydroxymethylglutaryl-CoA lyase, partial [Bacteroidia bacterium]|nr:hydroxymethylglutaryl-CoA lyase [Bacteroidia bacterium]